MKKSIIKKLICVVVSAFFILSTCACQNNSGNQGNNENVNPKDKENEEVIVDTGKYIVKDNKSDYTVLVPTDRNYDIDLAVDELVGAIKESCGYELPVTNEYDSSKKYISVGNTQLYMDNESKIAPNKLSYTEVRVKTLGDNVIINGNTTEDTVYATYEFLERTVGFKVYTLDDIYIKKLDNVKLYDIDLSETPDISIRSLRYGRIYNSSNTAEARQNHRRMRADFTDDDWFTSGHCNIGTVLPKSMYLDSHPEWYSKPVVTTSDYVDGGQLCLSNEEMTAEYIKRAKEIIQNDSDFDAKKFFMIGMQDNWDYCNCANCQALARANGGGSNRACNFIIFANKVEKAINDDWDWLKENHPDTQIQFVMFGYFHNAQAPIKYDASGNPVPYNDNVICDEHLSVLFAPLTGDFAYSIDDERSKIGAQVNEWNAVCQNFMYYSYCAQFAATPIPTNDLITLDGSVTKLIQNGGYYMQEQGATLTNTSGMDELGWYVRSNFMWDSSRSVDEYAYEFIDYFYMPVAESFKKYYNAFKAFQVYQVEKLNIKVGMSDSNYLKPEYWPKDLLDTFNDMLNGMIDELEPYKTTDPALYKKYFDRVNKEKVWIYYLYCENYKQYFNDADYSALIEFMRTYCAEYGINEYREYKSINEIIDSWQQKIV